MSASAPFHITESEAAFQRRVTDLAESLGWDWMHIGRTGKYSASGAKGTLGIGWPDLVLVKGSRILFVELKAAKGTLTPQQREVMTKLAAVSHAEVWRPQGWNQIIDRLTKA